MKKNFVPKGEFVAKISEKFHKKEYLEGNQFQIKNMEYMDKEKERLKTEDKEKVSRKIKDALKNSKEEEKGKVFSILEKIYRKNQRKSFSKEEIKLNSDLINLLSDVSLLTVAYGKVRKNPGAMTKAYEVRKKMYSKLETEEKSLVNKISDAPDGINKDVFKITSRLIKENRYPWGTSRRIQVDKPGKKDAKRPITIPPFMDKVVQQALTMILQAVYEPYFEEQNCSFGFRPNKGVHDAMITLTGADANGLNIALEGDIKSAYDKVDKKILIEILSEKIHDKKFLNFIRTRLDYDYYDTRQKKYIRPIEGLPQGGIDSPYLWNIYMLAFDEFINTRLKEKLTEINEKNRGSNNSRTIKDKDKRKIERNLATLRKIKNWIRNNSDSENIIKDLESLKSKSAKELINNKIFTGELNGFSTILKEIQVGKVKDIKIMLKNINTLEKDLVKKGMKIPTSNPNKIRWRLIYARYADDWIILTNVKRCLLEKIKEEIKEFLHKNLKATLSMEKTLITDLRQDSAHFLGFEVKTYNKARKGNYVKKTKNGIKQKIQGKIGGNRVFLIPDRQRIIKRLHMKGYCDKMGFPREIKYLSSLDDFSIIERYNSVLLGMALYYCEFIKNPERFMSRWFYIIRFSCIKTIAQKHKMSVRKVFKNYIAPQNPEDKSKEATIEVEVRNIIEGETYKKKWTLYKMEYLIKKARSLKRKERLFDIYWSLKKKRIVTYTDQDKHSITNDDFYDKINWINIRTNSSFDLPCAICGSDEDIEMHHIKHVRKKRYDLIDKEKTWEQAMSIKNRKQIPVCRECHMNLIHRGKYGGTKLSYICPKIMYDNRIITIESHINKGKLNRLNKEFQKKTLEQKGWKREN